MNCNRIREELVDVASGTPASPEVETHVRSCAECAEVLAGLRQTMALMDEWQTPEPSPYFDVRLRARLREEQARPHSWLEWLRKPALGVAATVLVAVGIGLFQGGHNLNDGAAMQSLQGPVEHTTVAQKGTAVGDLQFLEKNSELLSDFDALDVLDTQDVNSTQLN
ncbi:MAG TPA: hypothetical protein VN622_01690 [Clostridia bacterium]|nr:hypothetical protein [Clostridia bacterium]